MAGCCECFSVNNCNLVIKKAAGNTSCRPFLYQLSLEALRAHRGGSDCLNSIALPIAPGKQSFTSVKLCIFAELLVSTAIYQTVTVQATALVSNNRMPNAPFRQLIWRVCKHGSRAEPRAFCGIKRCAAVGATKELGESEYRVDVSGPRRLHQSR